MSVNEKYIDKLCELMGVGWDQSVATPMIDYNIEELEQSPKLDEKNRKLYCSGVGIALYIAPDRLDCQNAIRVLSQHMCGPTEIRMNQLMRLSRYLNGTRTYKVGISDEGDFGIFTGISDSDLAGDKSTRKSCTCGTFFWGKNLVMSFARTQKPIAMSSAEAEYYGASDVGSELIFFGRILAFLNNPVKLELMSDSSAALGIARRLGVGRIRHLESRSL